MQSAASGNPAVPVLSNAGAPIATPDGPSQSTPPQDNLQAFVPSGQRILASQTGDLNGDGRPDVLLVLDTSVSDHAMLGEGSARMVALLVRDAAGQLHKVATNDKLVPCAQCGGVYGDPYSYSRIDKNGLTVVTEGGSRQHWSNTYTFTYAAVRKDWLLSKVEREVVDKDTGKSKMLDLAPENFGVVTFANADPSALANVALP